MKKKSREETGPSSGIELWGELLTRATDLPRKIHVGVSTQSRPGVHICEPVQVVSDIYLEWVPGGESTGETRLPGLTWSR